MLAGKLAGVAPREVAIIPASRWGKALSCEASPRRAHAGETAETLVPRARSSLTTAPPFSLPTQKGEQRSLEDYLKKGPVLLAFHRGTWCPTCSSWT